MTSERHDFIASRAFSSSEAAKAEQLTSSFYVVARESGAERAALPVWASHRDNPVGLALEYPVDSIERRNLDEVPGAYQLLNVLSATECLRLITLGEALGFHGDAAVSLPRTVRHNDNVVWITDEATDGLIWQRVAHLAERELGVFGGKRPLGLNARFRFYRYGTGDYFRPHSDGSWPGSRVIDGQLVANAYPDRYSLMTFLIFLNDNFAGGATRFLVPEGEHVGPARRAERYREVDVRTPQGAVLCFPHGLHILHCIHSSEPVTQGVKYIIRTDMLFEL